MPSAQLLAAVGGAVAMAVALQMPLARAQASAVDPLPQLPPEAASYLRESWRSALQAPLPANLLGVAPAVLPQGFTDPDATGASGSHQTRGQTVTARSAFFRRLGSNGRTCETCHAPADGMGVSVASVRARFAAFGPRDAIFAPVDGADCPSAVATVNTAPSQLGGRVGLGSLGASDRRAYSLLLTRAVFRIFLPVPANANFTISVVHDPAGCNTDPDYNQTVDARTGKTTQIISVYRRPKVSANLAFVTAPGGNIMYDGREPTLESQAISATLTHTQATIAPTAAQVRQIVEFEAQFFSAQQFDDLAGELDAVPVHGGPLFLSSVAPTLPPLPPQPTMTLYDGWAGSWTFKPGQQRRASIYRGQTLFNARQFMVANAAGAAIGMATCSTCHSQSNTGASAFAGAQIDTGVTGSDASLGGPAPAWDLPIFKVMCNADVPTPLAGPVVYTNDPGRALISGKCADTGRITVATLRGMASRAPFFHDGSAASLLDVVEFYDRRFAIGLSAAEKTDLANFLQAL